MNKVILIGRLVRDNEVRYSAANMAILKNAIAVDRRGGKAQEGQPTADFINVTAFGKTAEFISNYFSKGNRLAVTGRIQTGSYDNAEGKKVYTTDVIIEEVEFVESKRQEYGDMPMAKQADPGFDQNMPPAASNPPAAADGYFPLEDDGEIPF